jgi:hypothetical protein
MKNIQKQYTDLLEGKMSKQNFMRNVRMEFPQHVTNVSSFEDTVKILKGKRILSEAAKPEGVYGHNPNAETPPAPGIDQLNYYQVYHGIQYELAQMPEITDEAYIKARKKVVDTILKDPDAYKQLQLANFKAVKAMDEDLKMKEVKENNLTDKPNEMKVVKKDAKANTEDTLEKKEKKKAKNGKGIQIMTQTPKKTKGIAKVMEVPGKEKVKALKENIMQEMTRENPTYEHFQVGARVKKKDNSLVGEITEWDGDTATIKTDEGEIHHVQGNILTKGDIPTKEDTPTVNPKAHVPEDTEKKEEGYMGTSYDSSEDMAVDMVNKGIKEERASKLKSLKEKLMKVVREVAKVTDDRGTVVALKANAADAQEFVQGQEPAVKSKLKVTA